MFWVELSTFLKHDARLFSFIVKDDDVDGSGSLDLPEHTSIIFYYRKESFHFFEENKNFKKGDEIVLLTHSKYLSELKERWTPDHA